MNWIRVALTVFAGGVGGIAERLAVHGRLARAELYRRATVFLKVNLSDERNCLL